MDITTIFFDFDGVVADTEPLYDIFWRQVAEKYHIGIPDFPAKIKGTTLQRIYELYFSDYSSEELGKITRACDEYEVPHGHMVTPHSPMLSARPPACHASIRPITNF